MSGICGRNQQSALYRTGAGRSVEYIAGSKGVCFCKWLNGSKRYFHWRGKGKPVGHKKLSSAALDYLYTKGELCVAKKIGTQKQFDLTERVIPKDYFSGFRFMMIEQFLDWYVKRRIAGVGILWGKRGGAWQGNYLWDNELRKSTIARLVEKGELKVIHVEGVTEEFYCCEDFLQSLKSEKANDYARFIAPLDNMIWDRKMTENIFDFSYSWEVYTPVSKRKYGYYVLLVLYNDNFVARFEAVPISKGKCFEVKN